MTNRALFLDVDGVLNNQRLFIETHDRSLTLEEEAFIQQHSDVLGISVARDLIQLDPVAVKLLNQIEDRAHPIWVLSSTWRIFRTLEQMNLMLNFLGFKGTLIGKTPEFHNGRGREIDSWLEGHPEVKHIVILDDDSDMVPYMSHLVKTTFVKGLEQTHVDQAVDMLSKPLTYVEESAKPLIKKHY